MLTQALLANHALLTQGAVERVVECVGELVSHALGKIGKLADGQGNVSRVMCDTFYMPTLSEQMHMIPLSAMCLNDFLSQTLCDSAATICKVRYPLGRDI